MYKSDKKTAFENDIPFKAIHIKTKEQARSVPSPCTSYAMFYNGGWSKPDRDKT
ncbi:MAG: hypothetical protein HFH56_09190 [Lachnospiraceae bacterium]|nr:hypothetical protein [Lachnospiraceae bacterium]MCI9471366.1 hypothetical protein [Lachnospiraceae bacterium]